MTLLETPPLNVSDLHLYLKALFFRYKTKTKQKIGTLKHKTPTQQMVHRCQEARIKFGILYASDLLGSPNYSHTHTSSRRKCLEFY